MNEEISVTLVNNTSAVQPITLFTEIFAIPPNLTVPFQNTFSWDISGENFFYGSQPVIAQIQYNTSPVIISTPYTNTGILPSTNVAGVVSALNGLGVGTFTSSGSIISITSSTYFFGGLRLAPSVLISVTSNTPSANPSIVLIINGITIITLPSGVNTGAFTFLGQAGDSVDVQYSVGVGVIVWNLSIINELGGFINPIIYATGGGGGGVPPTVFSFTYPSSGSVSITLNITP